MKNGRASGQCDKEHTMEGTLTHIRVIIILKATAPPGPQEASADVCLHL